MSIQAGLIDIRMVEAAFALVFRVMMDGYFSRAVGFFEYILNFFGDDDGQVYGFFVFDVGGWIDILSEYGRRVLWRFSALWESFSSYANFEVVLRVDSSL